MTCVHCAREIDNDSQFCRFCGTATQQPAQPVQPARRLVRLPDDGAIAGVCAGLAAYFSVDVTLVRLAWIILSIVPGGFIGGLVVYVVLWAIVPTAHGTTASTVGGRRLHRSVTDVKVAGVCAGLAEYFGVDATIVRIMWAILTIVPGAIVLGVLVYVLAWAIIPAGSAAPPPLHHAPPTSAL